MAYALEIELCWTARLLHCYLVKPSSWTNYGIM